MLEPKFMSKIDSSISYEISNLAIFSPLGNVKIWISWSCSEATAIKSPLWLNLILPIGKLLLMTIYYSFSLPLYISFIIPLSDESVYARYGSLFVVSCSFYGNKRFWSLWLMNGLKAILIKWFGAHIWVI